MFEHCRTSRSRQSSVNGSQEDLIDRPSVSKQKQIKTLQHLRTEYQESIYKILIHNFSGWLPKCHLGQEGQWKVEQRTTLESLSKPYLSFSGIPKWSASPAGRSSVSGVSATDSGIVVPPPPFPFYVFVCFPSHCLF